MNLISCTDSCKFQIDGYCTLNTSKKNTDYTSSTNNCMYFTPKKQNTLNEVKNRSF